ncbi:MAG TPA: hypothetical protein VHM23_07180 [Actinomycetota bacterium]|jgi:hypothetical protein|nr:hypothetical protein [Actinomycetota bacterium]
MPKLTRGLVVGAMLAVLSSATAAVAQPPDSWSEAVAQHRAGERASMSQSSTGDAAVQRFRAGERASMEQPISDKATEQAMAEQRRWYYQSTHPLGAPGTRAASSEQPDQPVALIAALVAAAVLARTLDALSIRRKARKAAYPAT